MAIKRIWHGWTTQENADKYQTLLLDEVFPGIEAKKLTGFQSLELLRRELNDEVEFITIMTFQTLQHVIQFQEQDCPRCFVPDKALKMLKHWDQVSSHYEEVVSKAYEVKLD